MLLHNEKLLCEVWTSKFFSNCDPHRTSFSHSPVPVNLTLAKMLRLEKRTVSFSSSQSIMLGLVCWAVLIRCTTGALTRFWCLEKGCDLQDDFPLSSSATPCVKWWWWYWLLIKISSPRATADFPCCSGQALQCSLLWARQDKQALVAEPFLKAHLMLSTCCLGRVTKRLLSSSSSFCDLCPFGFRPGYSMDFLGLPSTSQRSVSHADFITSFGRVKDHCLKKKTTGKPKISRFHRVGTVTLENKHISGRTDRRE